MAVMRKISQGARLRAWRKSQKLTQRALATQLAIQQGSLAAYETEKRVPRIDVAARIERITKGEVAMQGWAA